MQDDLKAGIIRPGPILQAPVRAAQYLRMSTDHQKYSTQNQADAIAEYASRRGFLVVQNYADEGRSGLRFENRAALKELISHVRSGEAEYEAILVYDVSRWGRFQDVDESAYYEFICREAGIQVIYCAEQFDNDGSLASTILKSIKRAMAGEFSRELSNKVFMGQCRVARLGFWRGGPAGLGLRRCLIDEHGRTKALLESGQHKYLQTDRVVLTLGPLSEVETVQRVFRDFVVDRKTESEIARELNATNIRTTRGGDWTAGTIGNLLTNEKYIGNIVFNRRFRRLQQRCVMNPPEMWIRCDNALDAIVPPSMFAKAQELHAIRKPRHLVSDQQALDRLSALLKRVGSLSENVIQRAKDVPSPITFIKRFGSLVAAYDLVGFGLAQRYRRANFVKRISAIIETRTQELVLQFENLGVRIALDEMGQIVVNDGLIISICVARAFTYMPGKRRWRLRWARQRGWSAPSDLTLVIKMDDIDLEIAQYYLAPSQVVRLAQVSEKIFRQVFVDECLHGDLESVAQTICASPLAWQAAEILGN